MISLIVAMDINGVIGVNNQLPWHLPEDLKYFKEITTGHPIVMGRKTRDSIGRNLPNRENVVITRNQDYNCEGCTIFHSVDEFYNWSNAKDEEIFVIGGAELFAETLSNTDRLYITRINHEFEGDTFFPALNWQEWKLVSEQKGIVDEKNIYSHVFYVYERTEL
ncbi:dihydrofolate reductase [Niallia sp. FSL W8-0635]|uniref:dihydrofolate reductase n=1 Tax=Niallia sp. FSL W8-0635 TaxID=2975337 RepID=UPI0009C630A9|nr:dihydrofolate reductase [Mycobacteroides abscessus subsp. abscessus]HEO8421222.1 dihydrofolate reductase [Yersinia enterocolitica]